jgi:hypothetical protein
MFSGELSCRFGFERLEEVRSGRETPPEARRQAALLKDVCKKTSAVATQEKTLDGRALSPAVCHRICGEGKKAQPNLNRMP